MTLELNKERRVVFKIAQVFSSCQFYKKTTQIVSKLNYGSPFRHIQKKYEFDVTNSNS